MSLSPIGSNDNKPGPKSAIIIQVRDKDYPHLWWDAPSMIRFDATGTAWRAEIERLHKITGREYRIIDRTVSETILR